MIRRNVSQTAYTAVSAVRRDLVRAGQTVLADWLSEPQNHRWALMAAHFAERGLLDTTPAIRVAREGRFVTHHVGADSFASKTERTLNAVDTTGETERGVPAYPVNTIVRHGKDRFVVLDVRGNGLLTLLRLNGRLGTTQGYSHLIEDPKALLLPERAVPVKPCLSQILRFTGQEAAHRQQVYEDRETMHRYIVVPLLQPGESDPFAVYAAQRELGPVVEAAVPPLPAYLASYR